MFLIKIELKSNNFEFFAWKVDHDEEDNEDWASYLALFFNQWYAHFKLTMLRGYLGENVKIREVL